MKFVSKVIFIKQERVNSVNIYIKKEVKIEREKSVILLLMVIFFYVWPKSIMSVDLLCMHAAFKLTLQIYITNINTNYSS